MCQSLSSVFSSDASRSTEERARLCAANNADLYQAIFRAHGLPDRRTGAFWSSDAAAPPYYSSMTTLNPDALNEQLAEIDRLTSRLGSRPGLKDGFSRLDLADRGFRVLFSASWIWREPDVMPAPRPADWVRINDAAMLHRWEREWKSAGSPTEARVFPPALLAEPDLHVYGRIAGDGFDAGFIVNRSPDVVGLSNLFSMTGGLQAARDAVSLAATAFSPDLPLVGYDSGDALDDMMTLDFRPVGSLRVWLPQGHD